MLLSGDEATARWQWDALMDGYESIREFDWRERRLIEPLRTLRMIHHSAWLARRWGDPAFPLAFPWFGTPNYWNDQVAKLAEQLEAMQSAAETPPSPAPTDDDDFHLDGDSFSYKRFLQTPTGPLEIVYTGVVSGDTFTAVVNMGGFEAPYTGVRVKTGE